MTRLHAPLGMCSQGEFETLWDELEQTDQGASALAHQSLSRLYSDTEPQIEWIERDDAYWLIVDYPGMYRDDFSIDLEGQFLTLQGERTETASAVVSFDQGRPNRAFARRFFLEKPVVAEAMTTTYADGVLAVCLPKAAGQPMALPAMQLASLHDN